MKNSVKDTSLPMADTTTSFVRPSSLPEFIRFGTSSWTYEDWVGSIYKNDYASEKEFKKLSLREYSQHSLFTTVGMDSFFYHPPSESLLLEYASLVASNFKWVSKVWEKITTPHFPNHARYGKDKGLKNSQFLSLDLMQRVLEPLNNKNIWPHVGPFVFQFPYIHPDVMSDEEFLDQLEGFLTALPDDFQYAVELRNPSFLNTGYVDLINQCGVSHCFNQWNFMISLRDQMKFFANHGGLEAPFFVARILTPQGISYEKALEMMKPYTELKISDTSMQQDVETLIKRAIKKKSEAFILMNNQCEGNAPQSLLRIAQRFKD